MSTPYALLWSMVDFTFTFYVTVTGVFGDQYAKSLMQISPYVKCDLLCASVL